MAVCSVTTRDMASGCHGRIVAAAHLMGGLTAMAVHLPGFRFRVPKPAGVLQDMSTI